MSSKRIRADSFASACTECQRRKGKCSGGRPCAFCSKTGRRCIDQPVIERIPLTRKNMDMLQTRCRRLEDLVRAIDPTIDIEQALRVERSLPENSYFVESEYEKDVNVDPDEEMNPAKFEWREEYAGAPGEDQEAEEAVLLADGMASLNIDSRDVGYLGRSAGATLLRHVHRLLEAYKDTSGSSQFSRSELRQKSPTFNSTAETIQQRMSVTYTDDMLIDAYYVYHHPLYPFVHESSFRTKMNRWRRGEMAPCPQWHTLYKMIMVTGAVVSTTDWRKGPMVHLDLYKQVEQSFSVQYFSYGTLEGVQALMLMGIYIQKGLDNPKPRPNTGYNVLGMALRMGLALGLHRETDTGKRTLGLERRRRTFWSLYIFDVGASITFGRPTIPSDKVFTDVPSNVADYNVIDYDTELPPPVDKVTVNSSMIAHSTLVIIMNRIHLALFLRPHSPKRFCTSCETLDTFDNQILTWRKNLPEYFFAPDSEVPKWFRAPRALVLWRAENLRMLMYKFKLDAISCEPQAFDRGRVKVDPAVMKCCSIALATIDSILEFCGSRKMWYGIGWYGTYFVFQPALILITAILLLPTCADVEDWRFGVVKALDALKFMDASTPSASRVSDVLTGCLERIDQVIADGRRAFSTMSPCENGKRKACTPLPDPEEAAYCNPPDLPLFPSLGGEAMQGYTHGYSSMSNSNDMMESMLGSELGDGIGIDVSDVGFWEKSVEETWPGLFDDINAPLSSDAATGSSPESSRGVFEGTQASDRKGQQDIDINNFTELLNEDLNGAL